MDYFEYITDIVMERGFNKPDDGYYEGHHIIPKCIGGTDKDGVVYLTPQEHYEAHRLLAIENPQISGLQYA